MRAYSTDLAGAVVPFPCQSDDVKPEQIERIEESWRRLEPHRAELGGRFYSRLFELEPSLRDLFVLVEMDSQSAKFLAMLNEVLRAVRDPEAFRAVLGASGARHRGYGVVARHYKVVGEALIWALEQTAPIPLSDEARRDWIEAYTLMSNVMQKGAEPPRA
jgi:hemoglobin-like flavoprotein